MDPTIAYLFLGFVVAFCALDIRRDMKKIRGLMEKKESLYSPRPYPADPVRSS